jgi:glycosyltransferase involved in cell wall biosynthesis
MNIWYIHPYGGGPGIGRFFRPFHLANEWKKIGHSTTVFVADYHHLLDIKQTLPTRQNVEGVDYVALSAGYYQGNGKSRIMNMARFCASLWATRKRVGKDLEKPDAIIVSSPHPFAIYPARALAKRFGAKLVFEVRDLWPLSITEINGSSKWHPFVLLTAITERYAYKKSDLVASLLPGVENYMRERNMAYKNFVWVPNGVETQAQPREPKSGEGKRLLDLINFWKREGRKIIVHPGSMGPPNGLENLVNATSVLNQLGHTDKIAVLIFGNGISRSALEELSGNLKTSNIEFGGPVPKAEAVYLTAACDIGYCGGRGHNAVYKYGISFNKIIDYASAGLPMVLPFKALLDPVTKQLEGLIVTEDNVESVADAIAFQLKRKKIKSTNSKYVEAFSYSKIARNYLDAIHPEK